MDRLPKLGLIAHFGVGIAYHARHERDLDYRYYPDLQDMARDVDVLVVATPGGGSTRHLVDEGALHALGPE